MTTTPTRYHGPTTPELETRILEALRRRLTGRQLADVLLGRSSHGLTVRECAVLKRAYPDIAVESAWM